MRSWEQKGSTGQKDSLDSCTSLLTANDSYKSSKFSRPGIHLEHYYKFTDVLPSLRHLAIFAGQNLQSCHFANTRSPVFQSCTHKEITNWSPLMIFLLHISTKERVVSLLKCVNAGNSIQTIPVRGIAAYTPLTNRVQGLCCKLQTKFVSAWILHYSHNTS